MRLALPKSNRRLQLKHKKMSEIEFEFLPYFRSYKNGRVERFFGTDVVPASLGSETGVSSEDVTNVPENTTTGPSIYTKQHHYHTRPKAKAKAPSLDLLPRRGLYVWLTILRHYLTSVVASANVVAISIDYRLAPEHPLPAAFEDSWDALKWAASHSAGHGPEAWLNEYADFRRAFVAGDSAGSTIAHAMAVRAGEEEGLGGLQLVGLGVIHPDFASKKGGLSPTAAWNFACPATAGWDDPRINPAADSRLSRLGCERVLICVAEFDEMKERGWLYYDALKESGWKGKVEILETPGAGHAFHLFNPTCTNAVTLLKKLASFLHHEE